MNKLAVNAILALLLILCTFPTLSCNRTVKSTEEESTILITQYVILENEKDKVVLHSPYIHNDYKDTIISMPLLVNVLNSKLSYDLGNFTASKPNYAIDDKAGSIVYKFKEGNLKFYNYEQK